jgi:hypothetical protein
MAIRSGCDLFDSNAPILQCRLPFLIRFSAEYDDILVRGFDQA